MLKRGGRLLLPIVLLSLLLAACSAAGSGSGSAGAAPSGAADVAAAEPTALESPTAAATAVPTPLDLPAAIDPATVAQLNADGKIVVIDVREQDEYDAGHIEGAQLIPLGTLPDQVDQVPTDRPVVLVCRSGNRSGQAFNWLKDQGFTNISNMTGGMIAWEADGLAIAR